MSVWHNPEGVVPPLVGREGELVVVSIQVEPHRLEELLDTLARVTFPVNPQLYHQRGIVEFPAYSSRVGEVRSAMQSSGFDPSVLRVRSMLEVLYEAYPEACKTPGAPPAAVVP